MNCNGNCRLCDNLVISDSISTVTVNTVSTLVIDIPSGTYMNNWVYCIVTAQSIPTDATIDQPVAVSIGGDTTTVYPLVSGRTGLQVSASQLVSRVRIKTVVRTSATSGAFIAYGGLNPRFENRLSSLPAPTTTTQSDEKAGTVNE